MYPQEFNFTSLKEFIQFLVARSQQVSSTHIEIFLEVAVDTETSQEITYHNEIIGKNKTKIQHTIKSDVAQSLVTLVAVLRNPTGTTHAKWVHGEVLCHKVKAAKLQFPHAACVFLTNGVPVLPAFSSGINMSNAIVGKSYYEICVRMCESIGKVNRQVSLYRGTLGNHTPLKYTLDSIQDYLTHEEVSIIMSKVRGELTKHLSADTPVKEESQSDLKVVKS